MRAMYIIQKCKMAAVAKKLIFKKKILFLTKICIPDKFQENWMKTLDGKLWMENHIYKFSLNCLNVSQNIVQTSTSISEKKTLWITLSP